MRKKFATIVLGTMLSFIALGSFGIVVAEPNGPQTGEIWICPSVSTNNPNGMWVVGHHGAYYILKPGTASHKWPMILNPTGNLEEHAARVEHLAQIPAGWGLYKDLPTYPYFEGMAMVLPEGAAMFDLDPGMQLISASQGIPLASAVFW
ncbi:MAG: hypothetical protein ACE5R6_21385 [Candidatus Heimdallarchaeota archaeon]